MKNYDTICIIFESINDVLPPPRQPNGRVLASSAGGTAFAPQLRTASYQIRYKNGTR